MRPLGKTLLLFLPALAAAIGAACDRSPSPSPAPSAAKAVGSVEPAVALLNPPSLAASAGDAGAPPTFACGNLTVPIGSAVPGNSPVFINQTNADCFAWWEFISLNWPASSEGAGVPNSGVTAATLGEPGDMNPLVWQTYQDPTQMFPDAGAAPPAFGTQPEIPDYCAQQAGLTAEGKRKAHLVQLVTKFATGFNQGSSSQQAAPQNGPNWLGAQNGTNLWYEIRLNQDEYSAITEADHQFYNANQQAAWVNDGGGKPIVLPEGVYNGATGTIELKGAWMEVTNPSDARWKRYKLISAVVIDTSTEKCRSATMALVGLHILHKTTSQPTWVWATFEHVDNVPDPTDAGAAPEGGYNFFNPSCQPQKVDAPADCIPEGGTSPVTVDCTPNQHPPYYLGEGCPAPVPIQITRQFPIASTARTVNPIAQKALASANPSSVWQYYQLVNVLWSSSPPPDPPPLKPVPAKLSGMLSDGQPVANTTLESYVQKDTCTDCHAYATIAPTAGNANPVWSSDFSFMLGTATAPPQGKVLKQPPKKKKRY